MHIYDVIIIGAGSAGLAALREVRKATDNFLIINDGPYGTTCARVGCMPSKALIEAANAYHARHQLAAFGVHGGEALTVDVPAVFQRVRRLRDRFVAGVLQATEDLGERNLAGRARLLDAQTVEVAGQRYRARRIIIAVGSAPVIPPEWAPLGDRLLTTDSLFEQPDLPRRIGVVGLGAIGIECAQALSRLGCEVFAFGQSERLAGIDDGQVNQVLRDRLAREFSLHTGDRINLAGTPAGVTIAAGDTTAQVDRVLLAVGRRPQLAGLGLENLGVTLDDRGLPPFDHGTLQIADLPVFIAGDANAHAPILHEAADEGYIAGRNAVADTATCYRRRIPFGIVFADPGVAFVGERYSALQRDGKAVLTGEVSFEKQGRALTAQENTGLLRLYAAPDSPRLLGAEMCAPAAEHMAHLLALAIERELTVHDLLRMPFYHPVLEEGLRTALRQLAARYPDRPGDLATCNAYKIEALD